MRYHLTPCMKRTRNKCGQECEEKEWRGENSGVTALFVCSQPQLQSETSHRDYQLCQGSPLSTEPGRSFEFLDMSPTPTNKPTSKDYEDKETLRNCWGGAEAVPQEVGHLHCM